MACQTSQSLHLRRSGNMQVPLVRNASYGQHTPFQCHTAGTPVQRARSLLVRSAQEETTEQSADVCPTCGVNNASRPKGCDGQGRIAGGLGAVVGWFPIKAYRPCPAAVKGNFSYTRKGQITDDILFGKAKQKR